MSDKAHDPRKIAVEIIENWLKQKNLIDILRDEAIAKHEGMDKRDLALLTEIVFGIVRHQESLLKIITHLAKRDPELIKIKLRAILLVALYQYLYLERIPEHALVNQAVEQAKAAMGQKPSGFVNAVLRSAIREKETIMPMAATSPVPDAWQAKWRKQWGEDKANALIERFSTVLPFGLRRNTLRGGDQQRWLEMLTAEGVKYTEIKDWPGYVYARGINPAKLASFAGGITTVPDPAAGIAPRLLDPHPHDRVADLCTAPGGKAGLIWEMMGGRGTLVAVDRSEHRNEKTIESLMRMQHEDIKVVSRDVLDYDDGTFDKILIDVPCSGTGVAARRADLLRRRDPSSLGELTNLQWKLLVHSASLVKIGGTLVYSTCSLEPEENGEMAKRFDKFFAKSWERTDIPDIIPQRWKVGEGEVATWPPDDEVDGMYAVRWRRIA